MHIPSSMHSRLNQLENPQQRERMAEVMRYAVIQDAYMDEVDPEFLVLILDEEDALILDIYNNLYVAPDGKVAMAMTNHPHYHDTFAQLIGR